MTLADELRRPEAWPAPHPTHVELIETHVSWVLRGEHDVFKIKKPVALGFLDFSSLEKRRAACDSEVRLNARLAPGVYLGVVPIVRRPDGALAIGGDSPHSSRGVPSPGVPNRPGAPSSATRGTRNGEVVDWAVHMARLDDRARADALLARGAFTTAHLDAVARAIADLHAGSAVGPEKAASFASPVAIERNVHENFAQIRDRAREIVDVGVAREVEERQKAFVNEHAALLRARLEARICEGHGDLRLEHVYLPPDGLRIIDCIEFDERYRIADACADVAFLAMDFSSLAHADLAERFLARYARATQDYDLYTLVDFYESYRAWVRGKVSAMLASDAGAHPDTRARALTTAREHFLLAQACERAPLLSPTLVCVGGIVASGKSTVADALADDLACPVVDSDRTRKHLLARSEERRDAAWQGAYDPAVTERVYAEVLRRASVVLSSGRSVVVDASFHSSAMRGRARNLARSLSADFRFVQCLAPIDTCRERLANRRGGPSDAHLGMFEAFATSYEPIVGLPDSEIVVLDTTKPLDACLGVLRSRISAWPRGLR